MLFEQKKRSVGKTVLLCLLVLLLLISGFAAYVFIRMSKESVENDDVPALLGQETMSVNEHFGVRDGLMTVCFDKADLYYLMEKEYGSGHLEKEIASLSESTGIDISAHCLKIDDSDVSLSIKGSFKGLPIAASVLLEPQVTDGRLVLEGKALKAAGITIPASRIEALKEIGFSFKPDLYFLQDLKEAGVEKGKIRLSGDLNADFLNAVDPEQGYDRNFTLFVPYAREILDAGRYMSTDPEKASAIFLKGVEELGFHTAIDDYFSVAYPGASKDVMKQGMLQERFLKKYADTDFLEKYTLARDLADLGKEQITLFTDQIYRDFSLNRFRIEKGQILFDGEPYRFTDLVFEGWEDVFRDLLKEETFRLVLVDDPNALTAGLRSLSKYADDTSSFAEETDLSKTYGLGYIAETAGGVKILNYNVRTRAGYFEPADLILDDSVFEKLSDASAVPVYTAER